MLKILKADKDAYITNRVIDDVRKTSANTGAAGSLDLYKLYGQTFSGSAPNIELTRLLLHFDLAPISTLYSAGKIDVNNNSFFAKLKLHDVYAGQTTPENYSIVINPLSASFLEGRGKDVALYSDLDTVNFLSSSTIPWVSAGCASSGSATDVCDFITSSNLTVTKFVTFDEDLEVDVTNIVAETLLQTIPDAGFRIALASEHELDELSYFVKRFASRHAFDITKHPKLIVGFDDSIQDDTQKLYFNEPATLFLYNKIGNSYANILSSSVQITGSNSLLLRLETEISGGVAAYYFTGSQHTVGAVTSSGIYSASITLSSSNAVISQKLLQSSSINFKPIWSSLDQTVSYFTGSTITVYPADINSVVFNNRYTVTTTGVKSSVKNTEMLNVRINIFDMHSAKITPKRLPIVLPGIVIRDVHYAIRDKQNNEYVIDFDTAKNSTRVSSDINGMYFKLDASNLIESRSYVIDVLITGEQNELYQDVSHVFSIHK